MWAGLIVGVLLLATLLLWFTVWAERRLDERAVMDAPDDGALAYVLVQAEPERAHDVASRLAMLPWAREAGLAQGPYDVIVRVAPGTPPDAHHDLASIDGVLRVLPCRAAPGVPAPAARPSANAEAEPAPITTTPVRLPEREPRPVTPQRRTA